MARQRRARNQARTSGEGLARRNRTTALSAKPNDTSRSGQTTAYEPRRSVVSTRSPARSNTMVTTRSGPASSAASAKKPRKPTPRRSASPMRSSRSPTRRPDSLANPSENPLTVGYSSAPRGADTTTGGKATPRTADRTLRPKQAAQIGSRTARSSLSREPRRARAILPARNRSGDARARRFRPRHSTGCGDLAGPRHRRAGAGRASGRCAAR